MKKRTKTAVFLLIASLALAGCSQDTQNSSDINTGSETQENAVTEGIAAASKDEIISNKYFSITMPSEFSGLYEVETGDDYICIYHKESRDAGFNGYEFGVRAYASPSEYVAGPASKIGELVAKDGTIYDIVRCLETEIQTDYEKEEPESYVKIYDAAEDILKNLTATEGNTFTYGAGMHGKDLYTDILQKHITAIKEKWDSDKLEEENMSTMYYTMSEDGQGEVLDRIGYFYHDVNVDGVDELFIGEIADGDWKGVIYDMYGMINRKPGHIITGWARNRYYICNGGTSICNEYSGGAAESGWIINEFIGTEAKLEPITGFKTDLIKNEKQPWFISHNVNEDKWENVTEAEFNSQKSVYEDYLRFDYIPLSTLAGN